MSTLWEGIERGEAAGRSKAESQGRASEGQTGQLQAEAAEEVGPPRATIEIWKPVAGFESHYEVSTHGRVRRSAAGPHTATGRILIPSADSDGYMMLDLCVGGRKSHRAVHAIVMQTFVGECPPGCTVNHIDTVKHHNWLSNLEYMTRGENIRQAFKDGMYPARTEMHSAKLTEANVTEIKALIGTIPNTRIAKRYGVSEMAIRKIRDGKTWRGPPLPPSRGGGAG